MGARQCLLFFQPATNFKVCCCTLGFDASAHLDDGGMWPTSFAILKIGPAEEKAIIALVKHAVARSLPASVCCSGTGAFNWVTASNGLRTIYGLPVRPR